MNTLISFEIARLLKEKGFDQETPSYYGGSGELLPHVVMPTTPCNGLDIPHQLL